MAQLPPRQPARALGAARRTNPSAVFMNIEPAAGIEMGYGALAHVESSLDTKRKALRYYIDPNEISMT
jgi:hypothetical protein